MTILAWVGVIFIFICGIALACVLFASAVDYGSAVPAIWGGVCALMTLVICGAIIWWCSTSESGKRAIKAQESNLKGGLERTVTLYSYDGEEIKSWAGKFDVSSSETETYFDIDGKRVIIHGGIVVNEEME